VQRLELRYDNVTALMTDHEQNLSRRRAFVAGAAPLPPRAPCELVVVHPRSGREFSVRAEAVWADGGGVGLELTGLDAEVKQSLATFVAADAEGSVRASNPTDDEDGGAPQRNLFDRVRGMNSRERDELARTGSLPERVAIERIYGGSVWEGLLQNPRITPAELARIAKNGSLPKPLVGTIVQNAGWLGSPELQRALLSNPRCTGAHLERVLRALKPADLNRLAQHCPYRAEVRSAVHRLVARK